MKERERWLTFEERSKWGDCPVCDAKDGEACRQEVGIPLGVTATGYSATDGVHLGRLTHAPHKVREVAVL